MFGFSKDKFAKDIQNFVTTHGVNITDKVTSQGQKIVTEIKEKIFPELKGYDRTPTVDGKYKYVIIMAGIKKENATVNVKNGTLFVIGSNAQGGVVVDFQQPVGKDEVVTAKLEDGIMTVTLLEAPENKTVTVE